MTLPKPSKAFLYTISAALMWAFGIIVGRLIMRNGDNNAFSVTLWSTIIAVPFWLFIMQNKQTEVKALTPKSTLILILMGLISTVGVGLTETFALKYSAAINYSFLIRTVLLFTIFFAYLFLDEKITRPKLVIATMMILGAYLLTTNGQLLTLGLGDAFTIAEAALIAFGNNVLGKLVTKTTSASVTAAASTLIGLPPLVIIAAFNHGLMLPASLDLVALLAGITIALRLAQFRAYQFATATYVTMVFSFTPVFVALMAFFWLGESLSPVQLLGGAITLLCGVAVEKWKV